jgi:hypothetical protein
MVQNVNAPLFQAINAGGLPMAGAKLYIYQTGTTTLHTVYSDEALTIPAANPAIAGADGVFQGLFLASAIKFKMVLQDANGVTLHTRDPVYSVGVSDTLAAENVSFDPTASALAATDVQAAIDEVVTLVEAVEVAGAPVVHTHVAEDVTDLTEAVDDRVAALIVAGTGISKTYDDTAGTLTIANTAGSSDTQVFPSSSTWTKPAWATANSRVYVRMWGGGGGGAGGGTATGGSGAAYCEAWFLASDLSAAESVVVGTGGAGTTATADGANGGDTTFKTFTAGGGLGGDSGAFGVAGGAVKKSGATFIAGGAAGALAEGWQGGGSEATDSGSGTLKSIFGGAGGGSRNGTRTGGLSMFGGNGGAGSTSAGVNGSVPGGGGGATGGDGGNGLAIITTFL